MGFNQNSTFGFGNSAGGCGSQISSAYLIVCCDTGLNSTVRCANGNCASGSYSTSFGTQNTASGQYSSIFGGNRNVASADGSSVISGFCNVANGNCSVIFGGCCNSASGYENVFIAGCGISATQKNTFFANCVSAQNLTTGNGVCVAANKVLVNYPLNYGNFVQTQILTATNNNTAYLIPFDKSTLANGISIVNNNEIKYTNAGIYDIQFSCLFFGGTGGATVSVWFSKNGNNIPDSNTQITVKNNEEISMTVDILESIAANDFLQIYWSSTTSGSTMISYPQQSSPTRPATPSIILTTFRIS